ncbi:MAG TPA: hypothetical protein VME43_12410 [Bryobacteraceae bacterium]|nr:hypothetical protein [Bryobacteraceae bacterium]
MYRLIGLFALGLCVAMAAGRPELNGTWQLDSNGIPTESKLKSETLVIHQNEDSVEISENRTAKNGKEIKDDIQCNTMGQECKVKNLQVSLWYNGAMLVLVETHNDLVTKTRFTPSEDGKTLHLEVIHMGSGPQKTENLTFTKQ